ncbi:MAG: YbaB/EbfC family nucleoid-associated protein [Parvibaculaceae bacterium]|nr:YbaB/EbfC family nucleoid-associated protein [Parvibaculaceae bacterium]
MKGIGDIMKQARELQSKLADSQKMLEELEVTGVAAAGMVEVVLSGKGVMKSMKIDPSLIKPDEAEILEDLILAAHSDAKAKAEAATEEKMKELTGGMPLPPGMNFGL